LTTSWKTLVLTRIPTTLSPLTEGLRGEDDAPWLVLVEWSLFFFPCTFLGTWLRSAWRSGTLIALSVSVSRSGRISREGTSN
jgi:hypothetical protein